MSKYYIARDKYGDLYCYKKRPIKGEDSYQPVDFKLGSYCNLDDTFFPEISWEDEEPKVLTIEESPWIKFGDRHPNIGDNIIIMYKNIVMDKIYYYPIIFNGWDGICIKQFDGYEAIAWMPIPEFKERLNELNNKKGYEQW